jgi:lipid-A-disaccharide synthase
MSGPRFFISAGEASGDLHASKFIEAVKRRAPGAEFFGLGGPKMAAAGCELLRDMTVDDSHVGLVGPLLGIGKYLRLVARVDRELAARRPDVCVFVDYPGLNFVLASRARVRRVPTMWYIPPQMWAWASFRVHKTRRRLTRVACIFPFDAEFYGRHGIDARFVGHPLMDHFAALKLDAATVAKVKGTEEDEKLKIKNEKLETTTATTETATTASPSSAGGFKGNGKTTAQKVVLLLPGSRRKEIAGLLPLYLKICGLMVARVTGLKFVMGCLNERDAAQAREILRQHPEVAVETFVGRTQELMSAADFALAKSGTTTLELACFGVPMIALYPISRWQYHLVARWFITTPYLSLPNAVAGRKIIPEYYLYWGPPEPIAAEAVEILTNAERNRKMRADLAEVRAKLGEPGASERAAEAALGLVGREIPATAWYRRGLWV